MENPGHFSVEINNPGAQVFGTAPTLVASSDSGLDVSFTSNSTGVCTVTPSGSLTLVSIGSCSVTAAQGGDVNYTPAAPVTQDFSVVPTGQTITFPEPAQASFLRGERLTLTAEASSGLPVSYSALTPAICSVTSDGVLSFDETGTCVVAADQAGTATIAAALRVTQTFAVGGVDTAVEAELVKKMQVARARALVLNQPDLTALLQDELPANATDFSLSSMGGNVDIARMGGPVWLRLSGSLSEQTGGTRDHYVQLSLGSHVKLGPQSILGLMATLDSISLSDPSGQADGQGWLVGPYLVTRLGETSLTFEMRALFGQSSDSVAQVGMAAADFDTDRSLLLAKLSGAYVINDHLTLRPKVSVASVEESSDAYLASGGTPIPGFRTTYGQQSIGLDLTYATTNRYGPLTLTGGLGWISTDDGQTGQSSGLSYSFGLTQEIGPNIGLEFGLSGQSDGQSDINRVGLSLNAAF